MASSARLRVACATLVGSVVAFVALYAVAVVSYPGGTWLHPHAVGHRFWENFLCDVLHHQALNGSPNPVGAAAMTAAMLALTAGLGSMWWLLATLFPRRPWLMRALRWLGLTSVVLVATVPLSPSDRFPAVHGVVTVAASSLSLLALGLALVALWRERQRHPALLALGLALALSVAWSAALYVRNQYLGAPLTLLLPASQKLAAALLLGWMLGVAREGCRKGH